MDQDELTPAEEKYFDSRGEAPASADTDARQTAEAVNETESSTTAAETRDESKPAAKMVPLAALHEERERRRREAEMNRVLATRLDALDQLIKNDNRPEAEKPSSLNEEPTKNLRQMSDEVQRAALLRLQQQRQAEAQRDHLNFAARYGDETEAFRQKQPDYDEAYRHLAADRDQELIDLGYTDPAERRRLMMTNETNIVARAFQDGVNPAERLYAIAKRRGYKPGDESAAVDGEDLTEIARRGLAAAKSLSAMSGTGPRRLSPEALANMSEEDFAEATKGEKWRKLFGR